MADEEDLVSQVSIEGADEAAAELEDYGSRGGSAFDKLATAAAKAAGGIGKAVEVIAVAAAGASDAIKNLNKQEFIDPKLGDKLKDIKKDFTQFGSAITSIGPAVAGFAKRTAVLSAGVLASGAAFALSASKIANSVKDQGESLASSAKEQNKLNQIEAQGEQRAISLASEQRKLQGQLARGEITYQDYAKAIQASNRDAREAERVAAQVADAQERVRAANERLQRQVAQQQAYDDLKKKLGGPLADSVIALGNAVNSIKTKFTDVFGPGLSKLVDAATDAITKNAAPIQKFAEGVQKQFSALATKYAPELNKAFNAIGQGASSVFSGLLAALPSLIKLFNDALVPAVKGVAAAFDATAGVINKLFGTEFTGGTLAAILIIGKLSGAFKLMGVAINILIPLFKGLSTAIGLLFNANPVIRVITLLVGALIALYATSPAFRKWVSEGSSLLGQLTTKFTDFVKYIAGVAVNIGKYLLGAWKSTEKGASDAVTYVKDKWAGITTFFSGLWQTISSGALQLWQTIQNAPQAAATAVQNAWSGIKDFFANLWKTISDGGAALWKYITDAAAAGADFIVQKWQQFLALIAAVWAPIQQAGAAVWQFIKDAAQGAVDYIAQGWSNLVTTLSGYYKSIKDGAQGIWDNITKGIADAVKFVTDTWSSVVKFFQDTGKQIADYFTNLWQGIKDSFQGAIDYVTGRFNDLYNSARDKLLPIIDWLKTIIGLGGQASGSGGGNNTVAAATGGHIRGKGTSTSDSIPAWLSNNEFVMKAKAVRKFGVGFMHMINSGRFDPGNIARFAQGGLVDALSTGGPPRYAMAVGGARNPAGARPSGMAPFNLQIGDEQFNGMLAPADVAARLRIHATKRATVSSGRRPAWQN